MTVDQDEILLRKKARRRLVGATLLTLILVLSLPLVLEDPSQPLGDGPDIVIPEPTKVAPPHAARVPDSLPDDNVGEEVLPVEAAAPPPAPSSAPSPAPPPAAAASAPPAGSPASAATGASTSAEAATRPAAPPDKATAPTGKGSAGPAATPAKPPTPARGHLLQLGLFKERANADKIAAQAAALGLRPVLAETAAGSWRVGVGPFADKAEALAARDKLREAGLAVVVKAP